MKRYRVYKHTAPNGKIYIGITSMNPKRRWGNNGCGYIRNSHFYNAIKKYGWDNFGHEVLYTNLDEKTAKQTEIELIKKYRSNDSKYGYNSTAGGESANGITPWNKGGHISDETKEKIRKTLTGKKLSLSTRRKLSEKLKGNQRAKGNVFSKESREKLSMACRGSKNGFYGKKHSEETHEKMRKHHADFSRGNHPGAKKVICLNTGETFDCVQDAADYFGLSYGQVKCNCQGKTKTTGKKKFIFLYLKEV